MRPRPRFTRVRAVTLVLGLSLLPWPALSNPLDLVPFGRPRSARPAATARDASSRAQAKAFRSAAPLAAANDQGEWQEYGLLQVSDAFTAWDAAGNRLLSLGGMLNRANYALPLAGPMDWQALPPMSEPAQLWGPLVARDASTGLVYFPGYDTPTTSIRALDPVTGAVTPVAVAGPAPTISPMVLSFDDTDHRLIVIGFSESFGELVLETWALELDQIGRAHV